MMLAADLPDAEYVKNFFMLLGWIIGIAAAVWKVMSDKGRERTIGPQPLKVQASDDFVQRREFDEHKGEDRREFTAIHELIDRRFTELNRERSTSIENLHKHIGSVAASIKGDVAALDDRISERLQDGNHTMVSHGEDIAALKAVLNKGGRR